jgi:large subunit ribosomal protein L11
MSHRWYFVRCQSGCEDSVRKQVEMRVKLKGLQDIVPQVLVPFERVTDLKGGKKRVVNKKLYPGYLMVQADIDDTRTSAPAWRSRSCARRAGRRLPRGRAASRCRCRSRGHDDPHAHVRHRDRAAGEHRLSEGRHGQDQVGAFDGFDGTVDEVNTDKGTVKVIVTIFGVRRPSSSSTGKSKRSRPARPRPGAQANESTMAKEVTAKIKLQCPAGQATPRRRRSGARLARRQHRRVREGVQRAHAAADGLIIPVEITVYKDRSFDFILKSPPAGVLLKKAAGLESAAKAPGHETAGKVTRAQVEEIAKMKMKDLNARDLAAACKIIEGTARAAGIKVEG